MSLVQTPGRASGLVATGEKQPLVPGTVARIGNRDYPISNEGLMAQATADKEAARPSPAALRAREERWVQVQTVELQPRLLELRALIAAHEGIEGITEDAIGSAFDSGVRAVLSGIDAELNEPQVKTKLLADSFYSQAAGALTLVPDKITRNLVREILVEMRNAIEEKVPL